MAKYHLRIVLRNHQVSLFVILPRSYISHSIWVNKSCLDFKNDFLVYSTWDSYSECSKTCGDGEKTKTRTCIGGICSLASSNDLIQTETCNERDCKFYKMHVLFQKVL